MGDMTTTILMTTVNLTVFPYVCQMETLGMKGLIANQLQCYIVQKYMLLLVSSVF